MFKSTLLSGGILLFCFSNSYSGGIITDSENSEKEKKSVLVGLKSGQLNYRLSKPPFGIDLYRTDTTLKGILKKQLILLVKK